jgi:uncharacterized membrane protein
MPAVSVGVRWVDVGADRSLPSASAVVRAMKHFARMVKPELGPGELAHCLAWTRIWGIYRLAPAAIGLVLARWAPLAVWTVYVGVVSYVLVGVLFAVEYVIRKIRFRDYGRNPLDWLLGKLIPAARSGLS